MPACARLTTARRLAAAAGMLVGAFASASPPSPSVIAADDALAQSRAALGRKLHDHTLYERSGRSLSVLSLRGKPLLVSLIYTSCDHSCTVATRALARNVRVARDALGQDSFNVITVGFDTASDTPLGMREYARRQGVDAPNWWFLSGDAATVEALIEDVGFTYRATPRGYDHIAQATLVDEDGLVYRQIYGELFNPPALVEPLKELLHARSANLPAVTRWVEGLRLICTVYDPAAGRYRFDNSLWVALVVGASCLGSIGFVVVRAWASERKRATRH